MNGNYASTLNINLDSLFNEHIKTLTSKKAIARGDNAIRLDKGELPYPPSLKVVQAIAETAHQINRYPNVLGGSLRAALAEYTGAKPEQIVIGNGSDDLIELILKIFLKPGDEVLLPRPTFFVYGFATRVVNGIPIKVDRKKDFSLDLDAIVHRVTPKTKVIFLANPNNPTANLEPRKNLIEILEKLDCIVVIDECYYEFCRETVADLVDIYPNLIVLRSLSKSFGLAGIRVGYAITNPKIADYLYRIAQLFPVNKVAIAASRAALKDREYIQDNIKQIQQSKQQLITALEELGLVVYPSATNFFFIGTKPLGITSGELVQSLQEKNVLVADFGGKQGLEPYYFRTAIGTPEENQLFLEALSSKL
ncbi:histidinol-phosphate aminotransferase [Xenococcus sp. PCC 7305]|uniref:histidinol-phosphate transaminase n=1 Tax=Xenococcus sp. PCC 7305 TaxID=102125 RepID=UPI0002ACC2C8|nr:histidinol-phosphate transaminase [Xenococcus sp. PCC 7305]ELS00670.1 histidinol-phosphate aminotransferase [Xenococcus sp. PCC 7305]